MTTLLVSSGYLDKTIELLRSQFEVINIPDHTEALHYLQMTPNKPSAMSIGYADPAQSTQPLHAASMIAEIFKIDPEMPIVISTSTYTPHVIVNLIKQGAFDYVVEPADKNSDDEQLEIYNQDLLHALTHAAKWRQMIDENRQLRENITRLNMPTTIQARCNSMIQVMRLVEKVAPTSATTLITGPSGTGKELIARTIHEHSKNHEAPFTAINCGALNETLLASELFGHTKGAFTGADQDRIGLIREAGKGTLFLDEISAVSPAFQIMLLRVLEQRTARPVGGNQEYQVQCRFVAASNENLLERINQGTFREDFYYRLNTFEIQIPPLSQRQADIPVLAHYFLELFNQQYAKSIMGIDSPAMNLLERYDWPGNVRQLKNAIERAVIVSEHSKIKVADFDIQIRSKGRSSSTPKIVDYYQSMQLFERQIVHVALEKAKGNLSQAARELGIKRTTLAYRIKQLGLRDSSR